MPSRYCTAIAPFWFSSLSSTALNGVNSLLALNLTKYIPFSLSSVDVQTAESQKGVDAV